MPVTFCLLRVNFRSLFVIFCSFRVTIRSLLVPDSLTCSSFDNILVIIFPLYIFPYYRRHFFECRNNYSRLISDDNIYDKYRFQIYLSHYFLKIRKLHKLLLRTFLEKTEKTKKWTIWDRLAWDYLKFAKFLQKFLFVKDSEFKVTKNFLI